MINITSLNMGKIKKILFTIFENILLSRLLAIFFISNIYIILKGDSYLYPFIMVYFIIIYIHSLIPEIIIRFIYREDPRKKAIIRIYKILLHLCVFCIFLLVLYGLLPYKLLKTSNIYKFMGVHAIVIYVLILKIHYAVNITNLNMGGKKVLFIILEAVLLSRLLAISILFVYTHMSFFMVLHFTIIYVYSLIPEIIIRFIYREDPRKKAIIRIYKILLHLCVFCTYLLIVYRLLPYDLLIKLHIDKILEFSTTIFVMLILKICGISITD